MMADELKVIYDGIRAAKAEEREACMEIVRKFRYKASRLNDGPCEDMAGQIMADIRARGAK